MLTPWHRILFPALFVSILAGCVSKSNKVSLRPRPSADVSAVEFTPAEKRKEDDFLRHCRAAESGNASALCRVGICYMTGSGTEKNETKGYEAIRQAAEKGDVEAKYRLALCYSEGKGTPANEGDAILWMTRAAADEHVPACQWLAGRGIYLRNDDLAAHRSNRHPVTSPPYQYHQHRQRPPEAFVQYNLWGKTAKGTNVGVGIRTYDPNSCGDLHRISHEKKYREQGRRASEEKAKKQIEQMKKDEEEEKEKK